MLIKVTKQHIKDGLPEDACECPVALAIGDAFPGEGVMVDKGCIHIGEREYTMPDEVKIFVRDFDEDHNRVFDEFEFELEKAYS